MAQEEDAKLRELREHFFILDGHKSEVEATCEVEKEQQSGCPTCFQETQHGKMLTRFNESIRNFSLEDKASFNDGGNVTT